MVDRKGGPEYPNSILGDITINIPITEATVQEKYEKFLSKLMDLRKYNQSLYQELQSGPLRTEGRTPDTFKDPTEWPLDKRLEHFKNRLSKDYKKYGEIIELYCDLYMQLEIDPFNINKAQKILDTLNS